MTSILLAILLLPSPHRDARVSVCPDTAKYFEFQVDSPARWVPDTTLKVHPVVSFGGAPAVVAFLVDSAGRPVPGSFKPMRANALMQEARRTFTKWRFTPAKKGGCHVRQLIAVGLAR